MVLPTIKQLYSTVYCQTHSWKNTQLCVGNSEGEMVVFNLQGLASRRKRSGGDLVRQPHSIVSAHSKPIYSMAQTPEFCVTGTTGAVTGWSWSTLLTKDTKAAWSINLDSDQANFGTPEVNSLAYDGENNSIYAACGDWKTRCFDLETGKQTSVYEGHEDYVHDVVVSGNLIVTAGEDGQVLCWDPRAGTEPKHALKPCDEAQLTRNHLGKFISSVDVENDWLVCGGGPRAGIFHLRSLALTTALPPPDAILNVTKFTKQTGGDGGSILIAGRMPDVYVCNMAGEVTAQIPSSSSCVYSVHITEKPSTVMTIGGMSTKVDVCLNLNYRDHTISTIPEVVV